MFRLFKKKYVYPELKLPSYARELTDEELFLVNGGSERRENSHEGVAGANVGDTIQRNDGTIVTLNQGDIDYAREQLAANGGSSGGNSGSSGSGSGSGSSGGSSGLSGSGSGSGSTGNTPSSPSSSNNSNDATANKVKDPDHHSAYDQQYINEMMENARKNALGGNEIQGNAVAGKTVGGEVAGGMSAGEGNLTERGYPSSTEGFNKVQVESGSSGSLARKGYPSTTDGYPDAYKPSKEFGENIYSIHWIKEHVPEPFQEEAIKKMKEEERKGIYGSPTDSKRITLGVGGNTTHQKVHSGLDVGAIKPGVKGDPIYATASGYVLRNGRTENSNSSILEIDLPYTSDTAVYQHGTFFVNPGDYVERGQVIGYMNDIGAPGQVHLHYEIRKNGVYIGNGGELVDPFSKMPPVYYYDK